MTINLFKLVYNFDTEVLLCNNSNIKVEINSIINLLMFNYAKVWIGKVEATWRDKSKSLVTVIKQFNVYFDIDLLHTRPLLILQSKPVTDNNLAAFNLIILHRF